MNSNLLRKCVATILAFLLIAPPGLPSRAWAAETVSLSSVEIGADEVKIGLSGQTRYDSFVTNDPPRLVLEIFDVEYKAGKKNFSGSGTYLKAVRASQFQRTPRLISRVVMDLNAMAGYHISQGSDGLDVVIGAADPPAAGAPAASTAVAVSAGKPEEAKAVVEEAKELRDEPSAELSGMTEQPEVAAISEAAATPAESAAEAVEEAPASVPPQRRRRALHGDILSRLPRDLVSLDFDNTDIRDVLKLLATKAKVNVIYGEDIAGRLSLHLVDVPFNEAFRTILMMMNLATSQVGDNILRVLTPAALAKAQTTAVTVTRVIPLNYSKASEMIAALNQVRTASGRTGTTLADAKTNSLIVTESLEGLAETERLVAQLDVRPKQVLIEVKLIEVGLSNSLNYGIQWDYLSTDQGKMFGKTGINGVGGPMGITNPGTATQGTGQVVGAANNGISLPLGASGRGTGVSLPADNIFGALTLGRITNNYILNATLTAAASEGKVKVLSDPKVATLNNQPATINVTTQIPYVTSNVASTGVTSNNVQYVTTGIQLTVTPSINADGRITLNVNPVVSQPSATAAANTQTGAPAIDSRNAQTTVLVKDGETIVIGGLISDSMSDTISKIPLLGDIPVLGWLFKKKSTARNRSELLVFVTPKITAD